VIGLAIWALMASAQGAQPAPYTLWLGPQVHVNDPYIIQKGLGATFEVPIAPILQVAASGSWFHIGGWDDLTPFSIQLGRENDVRPTVSRKHWRAELAAHWTPFTVTTDRMEGLVGLRTGFGVVRTSDSLRALQQEGDEYAEATRDQLHPTMVWGLYWDMGGERLRGRVSVEQARFVETISSTSLELHKDLIVSSGAVLRWGGEIPKIDWAARWAARPRIPRDGPPTPAAITIGPRVHVNDPLLVQKGLGGTLELPLAPILHVAAGGAWYRIGGWDDLTPLAIQLADENGVRTISSRKHWQADLAAHWTPVTFTTERAEGLVGLRTGFGMVRTSDNLQALDDEGDPYAEATRDQRHPTMVFGLYAEAGRPRLRGRLLVEQLQFVETQKSTTLELHQNMIVSAAVVLRWGGELGWSRRDALKARSPH